MKKGNGDLYRAADEGRRMNLDQVRLAELGPKTILVVDDDKDPLTLVAFVLESEGYKVMTAADDARRGRASRALPQ